MQICPNCQTSFNCGASHADRCWCMDLPTLPVLDLKKGCFCPSCLVKAIAAAKEQHLNDREKMT